MSNWNYLVRFSLVASVGLCAIAARAQAIDPAPSLFNSVTFTGVSFTDNETGGVLTITMTDTASNGNAKYNGTAISDIYGLWALDMGNNTIGNDLSRPSGTYVPTSSDSTDTTELDTWDGSGRNPFNVSTGSGSSAGYSDSGGPVTSFVDGDTWTFKFNASNANDINSISNVGLVVTLASDDSGFIRSSSPPSGSPEPFTMGLGIAGIPVWRFDVA